MWKNTAEPGLGYVKLTESHEIGGRWRSPSRIVLQSPPFGSLWLVAVPRPRIEIAKRLVFHLIKLSVELDKLAVVVAMEGRYVMAGAKS